MSVRHSIRSCSIARQSRPRSQLKLPQRRSVVRRWRRDWSSPQRTGGRRALLAALPYMSTLPARCSGASSRPCLPELVQERGVSLPCGRFAPSGGMGLGRWYDDLRRREDCRRAWFVFRLDTGCGVVCVLMGTRSMCAGSTGTHHAIAVPYTISEVSTRAPVRHSDEEGHRCYRYPHISLVAAGTATAQGVFLSRRSTADY